MYYFTVSLYVRVFFFNFHNRGESDLYVNSIHEIEKSSVKSSVIKKSFAPFSPNSTFRDFKEEMDFELTSKEQIPQLNNLKKISNNFS